MDTFHIVWKLVFVLLSTFPANSFKFFAEDEFYGVPIRTESILHERAKRDTVSLIDTAVCKFNENDGMFSIAEDSICNIDAFIKANYPNNDPLGTITKVFNGEHFNVESFSTDSKKKVVSIEASSKGSLKLFSFLTVGSVDLPSSLKLTFPTEESLTLQNINIQLSGTSTIEYDKNTSYEAMISLFKRREKTTFVVKKLDFVSKVDINHILSKIGIHNIPGGKYGLKQDIIKTEVSLAGVGAFIGDEEYQLIFKTHDSMLSNLTKVSTNLVVSKFRGTRPSAAVMVKYPSNAEIDDAVNPLLTKKCISKIPMTDLEFRARHNWCLIISDVCTKFMKASTVTKATDACYPCGNASIKKGIHVTVEVKLKDALKKCGAKDDESFNAVPNTAMLHGEVDPKGAMQFSLAEKLATPLQATISCLSNIKQPSSDSRFGIPGSNEMEKKEEIDIAALLPSFLTGGDDENSQVVTINEAKIDTETGEKVLDFTLNLPDKYNTIPFTDISFPEISCRMERTADEVWNFKGKASIQVAEIHFEVSIEKEDDTYTLEISCPSIRISDIVSLFKDLTGNGGDFLGTSLSDFGLNDFALTWKFGGSTLINIKGTLVLAGYDGISFQGMYWKPVTAGKTYTTGEGGEEVQSADQPANAFAFGLYFDGFDFDWLVKQMLGKNAFSVSWLSELKAVVAISNAYGKVGSCAYVKEEEDIKKRDINRSRRSAEGEGELNEVEEIQEYIDMKILESLEGRKDSSTFKRVNIPRARKSSTQRHVSADLRTVGVKDAHGKTKYWKRKYVKNENGSSAYRKSHVNRVREGRVQQDIARGYRPQKRNRVHLMRKDAKKAHGKVLSENVKRVHKKKADGQRIKRTQKRVPDEPALKFDIDGFEDIEIRPGLTFGLLWKLPSDESKCLGNKLCVWMSKHFQDFNVVILGYVDASFNLELSAEFQLNVKISDSLTFNYFKLAIVASAKPRVELECKMTYTNPSIAKEPLGFTGCISVNGKSLELSFSMDGFIIPPKWPYFSIGDLQLSIGYSPGPAPFPKLGFGMTLLLGKLDINSDNENAIRFDGRFEIDPNNPQENWIYVRINKLTIGAFCTAYELNCENIPSRIQESGFPEGLELSYSSQERRVEIADRDIPAGLQIKGCINILGLSAFADIKIGKVGGSWKFEVELILPLLNWAGGMIVVARDSSIEEGPRGWLKMGGGDFGLSIQGYAKVLLMYASVKICIKNDYVEFDIEGSLIPGLLDAHLNLKGKFESLNNFDISFRAEVFASDFGEKLKKFFIDLLQAAVDMAKKAIAKVQEKLAIAKASLASAKGNVQAWKDKIAAWRVQIKAKRDKYDAELKDSQSVDCYAQCPNICMPGLVWISCCKKIWGLCVGCLVGDRCAWMASDIICLGGCGLKKFASSVLAWFQKAFESCKLVLASIGQGFGSLAQGILSLAGGILTVAEGAMKFATKVLDVALEAGKKIIEAASNILKLNKLMVGGTLDNNYCGTIEFEIDIVILGKQIQASGVVSLNNIMRSLFNILTGKKESGLGGISETQNRVNEVSGKSEANDDAEGLLSEQEEQANKDMKSRESKTKEVTEAESRRDSIPIPEGVATFLDIPLTDNDKLGYIKSDVDPFFANAPWEIIDNYDPVADGIDKIRNAEQTKEKKIIRKRTLQFESVNSPCQRMKRALELYRNVAEGLSTTVSGMHEGYNLHNSTILSHEENLNKLKRDIIYKASRYNMSAEDIDRSYYTYARLADGYKELNKKSNVVLARSDSYALPLFRKQLNNILKRETGKSFTQFAEVINENAVKAYKRSFIPTAEYGKGLNLLSRIKKGLVGIVTNEEKPLSNFAGSVKNIRKDISRMSIYTKGC